MSGDHNEETWQEAQYHYRRQWGDAVAGDDHAIMDNDLYEVRVMFNYMNV